MMKKGVYMILVSVSLPILASAQSKNSSSDTAQKNAGGHSASYSSVMGPVSNPQKVRVSSGRIQPSEQTSTTTTNKQTGGPATDNQLDKNRQSPVKPVKDQGTPH